MANCAIWRLHTLNFDKKYFSDFLDDFFSLIADLNGGAADHNHHLPLEAVVEQESMDLLEATGLFGNLGNYSIHHQGMWFFSSSNQKSKLWVTVLFFPSNHKFFLSKVLSYDLDHIPRLLRPFLHPLCHKTVLNAGLKSNWRLNKNCGTCCQSLNWL